MNQSLVAFFLNFAGPIAFLGLVLWLHSLKKIIVWPSWRVEWPVAALALGSTAVIFLTTAIDFKVLSDETNLLSVANMLTLYGKASNTELTAYYYHVNHALNWAIPTRPVLFPVLISLVQHLVGLVKWAPFVVNFVLTFLLVWLGIRWARAKLPASLHPLVLGTLTILMSPIFSIVATSAGYDLCSLLVAFVLFLLLERYNEKRDEQTLACIFYGLVCFASVRYESIAAFGFMGLGLVAIERFEWLRKVSVTTILSVGILLVPLLVQRGLMWGNFENPPGVAAFSRDHFVNHLPAFFHAFFLDAQGPYPIILHWLGVGGIALCLPRLRAYSWVPLTYAFFLLTLLLAHHFGFAGHPTQARLFLPLSFALGLCALYAIARLENWSDPRALLAIFALLFLHHHQYAVNDPLTSQLTMAREVRHLRVFLAREDRRDDLFIYDRPGILSAFGQSTISSAYFEQNKAEYLANLRNKLYQRIFWIYGQDVSSKPMPSLEREGFRLIPRLEHMLGPDQQVRVFELQLL